MAKGAFHVCPHCLEAARVRSSRYVTPLYRQLFLQCTNLNCGATFAAATEILHMIAPSATPNPAIELRMAPPRRKAANDDLPLPANDLASAPEVAPPAGTDSAIAG